MKLVERQKCCFFGPEKHTLFAQFLFFLWKKFRYSPAHSQTAKQANINRSSSEISIQLPKRLVSYNRHITDSLDGRFSKSRDIAAHNGALRPKFVLSSNLLHHRLLFVLRLLLRHVIAIFLMGVGRGRERPGTLAYMTRKGQEESERVLLPFLLLAVAVAVAEHEICSPPPPSGTVTFRIYGPEVGSTANPFAAIRSTYEEFIRAKAGRVCRRAHLRPSFRLLSLSSSFASFDAICGLSLSLSWLVCRLLLPSLCTSIEFRWNLS